MDKLFEICLLKNESEKMCRQSIRTVLNKFTRSNIKLSVPLDMNQAVDLAKELVDAGLNRVHVSFVRLKDLLFQCNHFQQNIEAFNSQFQSASDTRTCKLDLDLNKMIDVQFKHKSTFVVLMAALQKRVGENLVASILLQRLIHLFVKLSAKEVFGDTQANNEETKKQLEAKLKLVALMSIVDKYCLIGASFEKQAVNGL